jgi:excisionase family DNA binding protein
MTTLLTTTEAAAALGISRDGVHKLVQRGTLKATRFANAYAFTPADVARVGKRPRAGAGGHTKNAEPSTAR